MPDSQFPPRALPYRHQFEPDEVEAIAACNKAHGFAVARGVLEPERIEALKSSVREILNPDETLPPGQYRTLHAFIEKSRTIWKLFENEVFLRICEAVVGEKELTVNRSAAIIRMPGAPQVVWHSDFFFETGPEPNVSQLLNSGEWPSGIWFYLNGTRPHRAGLAVIEDSHRPDWPGPAGFKLTDDRKSFYPEGEEPKPRYDRMEVPGLVPLYTEPGDLILFAARTYHAAFPHRGDKPRLSCGFSFRPRIPLPGMWEPPEKTRQFLQSATPEMRPYLEHYLSPQTQPA